MPANTSTLETHPQRKAIIDALAAGQPFRTIARWTNPPVTPNVLSRYKRRALDTLHSNVKRAKAAIANNGNELQPVGTNEIEKAALAIAADPFLARIARMQNEQDEMAELARSKEDIRAWAAVDGNRMKALEFHARLAGRIDQPPAGNVTNVQVICLPSVPGLSVQPGTSPVQGDVIDVESTT